MDTLGRNPLTIVNGSNQILYKVYDSDRRLQRTYTVNLGTISVHTNFGIAGVTEACTDQDRRYLDRAAQRDFLLFPV